MKELRAESLKKAYGDKQLFHDISFSIHEKDRIGLIGTNGTGKSSLLKALSEKDGFDGGMINKPHEYEIRYLSQDTKLEPNQTIIEAVLMGDSPVLQAIRAYELAVIELGKQPDDIQRQKVFALAEERMNKEDAWGTDTEVKIILQQLAISDIYAKINQLSGGQQKRVALAQSLIQKPDLLLLDEPTNHLDYAAIEWLELYLTRYSGAFIVVTHDRYFLDHTVNRIFELATGNLYEYKGSYADYLQTRAEREEREQQQAHKQQRLYKQELAWMRAGVQGRGTKQQARINRFNEIEKNAKQKQTNEELTINLGSQRLGKKVLEIQQGSYQVGDQSLLRQFDLLIQAGDRIGITGKNGAGKTTLLNILAGRLKLDGGIYQVGETVRIGYYTQRNEDMNPEKRVITYLQEAAEEVVLADGTVSSVAEMLERFLFPRSMHGTPIGKLSGGERRRLFLLKLLVQQPNVLLLDEPTNDLDIETLTILEDYIQQFSGAVISVSHDRYFLDKTAEKLLIFQGNGVITSYYGQISDYLASQKNQQPKDEISNAREKKIKQIESGKKGTEKYKLTYAEQLEWETIEQDIEAMEKQLAELTEEMSICGSDFDKLQKLQNSVDQLNSELEIKMERWEYLSQYAAE